MTQWLSGAFACARLQRPYSTSSGTRVLPLGSHLARIARKSSCSPIVSRYIAVRTVWVASSNAAIVCISHMTDAHCIASRLVFCFILSVGLRFEIRLNFQVLVSQGPEFCFEEVGPSALGLALRLGHKGGACAIPDKKNCTVMDVNGIFDIAVEFCGCRAGFGSLKQLLESRLFPATCRQPQTLFTFRALRLFDILSLESKVTAYQFCASVTRLTDDLIPASVKVCLDAIPVSLLCADIYSSNVIVNSASHRVSGPI